MKIIFLGTGTSQGVPMIANPNEGCDLSNPKNWRNRSCAHIQMDDYHIQIDASPEFRLQCIKNNIIKIDTFILTHSHADHMLGMDDLRRFCDLNGSTALPIYSNKESLDRVNQVYPYAINEKPVYKGYPAFKLIEVKDSIDIPKGKIEFVELPHGKMNVLGMVFTENSSGKRLAYFTDCKTLTEKAYSLSNDLDVLVIDGLRQNPHPTHMTIDEAIICAQKIKAKKTYITHMTHTVDYEITSSVLPKSVYLAYDNLEVIV